MTRKMYRPTEKQLEKWNSFTTIEMPSDDEFKTRWAKAHHGKVTGWGMAKRDWIVSNMKYSLDYQMGLWQGMVDKANGLDYQEQNDEKTYNLGYYRGYTDYESNRKGWDPATRERFDAEYAS